MIVATDATLALLPFDALVSSDGRWLGEFLEITLVDAARDLMDFGNAPSGHTPRL